MIHSPYLLIPPSETDPGVLQGFVGALLLDWSAMLTVAPRGRERGAVRAIVPGRADEPR